MTSKENPNMSDKCSGYGAFCKTMDAALQAFAGLNHGLGVATIVDGNDTHTNGVSLEARRPHRFWLTICPFCGGRPHGPKATEDSSAGTPRVEDALECCLQAEQLLDGDQPLDRAYPGAILTPGEIALAMVKQAIGFLGGAS